MARISGAGLVGILAAVFSAVQAPTGAKVDRPPSDDERSVWAALESFRGATAKSDTAALTRLLADGFTGLQPVGTSYDRASWIDLVAKGGLAFQKADDRDALGDELAVHGGVAAVHTALVRYRLAARKRDLCLQTRTVFAKLDGEWRVISVQGSLIHDGPLLDAKQYGMTGRYEIEGGGTYTVTKVGRTLLGDRGTGQKSPLFETADGGFVGPLGRWQFTAQKDDSGRVRGLTFRSDGKELWRARRVD